MNYNLNKSLIYSKDFDDRIIKRIERNYCYPLDLREKFDKMIDNCFKIKKDIVI